MRPTVMTRLGVVLLTYNRRDYAETTLRSTLDKLIFPDGEVQVHIASDGDGQEYVDYLRHIAGGYDWIKAVTHSNSERGGYGRNWNLATQVVHASCEYILALEDDWELRRPLDAGKLIEQMNKLQLGCVRLGYIGFTQELRCSFASADGQYWLRFDEKSPEPHVFAGHPRIEARWWTQFVGPWPENLQPGETEFAVAHRPESRQKVGWPLSMVRPEGDMFYHIGTVRSY